MKFLCGRFELDLSQRPLIMGIVNATPDSFSDGGQYEAIEHAYQLIEEGADILDIGGESTRPGSDPVSLDQELARVVPVVEALKSTGVPISVDTLKPEVMQAALEAGADMINDVYALRATGAVEVLKRYPRAGICLMHMNGMPKTMQVDIPDYQPNVTTAVGEFLQTRTQALLEVGISPQRIMWDPGFCFGKTLSQNYELLNCLGRFREFGAYPILAGMSRKSMIGQVLNLPPAERVYGSIAVGLAALDRGAKVLRVHDVKAHREALMIWQAIRG